MPRPATTLISIRALGKTDTLPVTGCCREPLNTLTGESQAREVNARLHYFLHMFLCRFITFSAHDRFPTAFSSPSVFSIIPVFQYCMIDSREILLYVRTASVGFCCLAGGCPTTKIYGVIFSGVGIPGRAHFRAWHTSCSSNVVCAGGIGSFKKRLVECMERGDRWVG